jgi:hypothetical protein
MLNDNAKKSLFFIAGLLLGAGILVLIWAGFDKFNSNGSGQLDKRIGELTETAADLDRDNTILKFKITNLTSELADSSSRIGELEDTNTKLVGTINQLHQGISDCIGFTDSATVQSKNISEKLTRIIESLKKIRIRLGNLQDLN